MDIIRLMTAIVVLDDLNQHLQVMHLIIQTVTIQSGHHGSAALVVVDMGNVEILARHVRENGWIGREHRIISK